MLITAVIGIVAGIVLRGYLPKDYTQKKAFLDWVAFPGTAFLRVMKCLDLPLIVSNIIVGIQGIVKLENAAGVGLRTGALYIFTSLVAAIEAVIVYAVMKQFLVQVESDKLFAKTSISFTCPSGSVVSVDAITNALTCSPSVTTAASFEATITGDEIDLFSAPPTTVGDLIQYIVYSFAPDNMLTALTVPNVMSALICAVAFGIAAAHLHVGGTGQKRNVVVDIMIQVREIFIMLMEALIFFAPFALIFLMAAAIATSSSLTNAGLDAAYLLIAATIAYCIHAFIMTPFLLFVFTRINPYKYLATYKLAYRTAFRTGSAESALDKTIMCAVESGEVSSTVAGFVLPLGIDLNLDGSGLYYPLAVLYLANIGGYAGDVTAGTLVIIVIVSTLAAIGAHQMPNGGLILILAIWQACFAGTHKVPLEIAYVLALQWFFDRCIATVNVSTDTVIAKIVDVTTYGGYDLRHPKEKQTSRASASSGSHGDRKRTSLWDAQKDPRKSMRVLYDPSLLRAHVQRRTMAAQAMEELDLSQTNAEGSLSPTALGPHATTSPTVYGPGDRGSVGWRTFDLSKIQGSLSADLKKLPGYVDAIAEGVDEDLEIGGEGLSQEDAHNSFGTTHSPENLRGHDPRFSRNRDGAPSSFEEGLIGSITSNQSGGLRNREVISPMPDVEREASNSSILSGNDENAIPSNAKKVGPGIAARFNTFSVGERNQFEPQGPRVHPPGSTVVPNPINAMSPSSRRSSIDGDRTARVATAKHEDSFHSSQNVSREESFSSVIGSNDRNSRVALANHALSREASGTLNRVSRESSFNQSSSQTRT
jgi:solute carrier family 1 (glutamate transporter), member 7